MKYVLEIYAPDSADDVIATVESDRPFAAMHIGELLNTQTLASASTRALFQIVHIEHILWEAEESPAHKICVYTKDVPDARQTRQNGPTP